jgi:hypothetical protein
MPNLNIKNSSRLPRLSINNQFSGNKRKNTEGKERATDKDGWCGTEKAYFRQLNASNATLPLRETL